MESRPLGIKRLVPKKKHYSQETKTAYCEDWRKSGLTQGEYCRSHGLSTASLRRWCLERESKERMFDGFSPVMVKEAEEDTVYSKTSLPEKIALKLILRNGACLVIPMKEDNLITFIQELSHAITVIR